MHQIALCSLQYYHSSLYQISQSWGHNNAQ